MAAGFWGKAGTALVGQLRSRHDVISYVGLNMHFPLTNKSTLGIELVGSLCGIIVVFLVFCTRPISPLRHASETAALGFFVETTAI